MMMRYRLLAIGVVCACAALWTAAAVAADYPEPQQGDYVIHDFHFHSGATLPEVKIHYRTLGKPQRDEHGVVRNAVLIMHGTTGSGKQFIVDQFAGELFGKGQTLDADKYYIILPDDIGHGQSSKPSDGLHAKFPNYRYADMIEAEHKLVTDGLGVNHLRLVMGTSMGGMHTWLWGEAYPDFMDALLPLASLPEEISGRNRMWRQMVSDAIRRDPQWKQGEYSTPPAGLHEAAEVLYFMSDNPARRYHQRRQARPPRSCWRITPTNSPARATPTMCCMPWKAPAITIRRRHWKKSKQHCWPSTRPTI